jgi:hypothetical protein
MDKKELVVVYETMDKKEIIRNINVYFIPRKGDHINFKGVATDLPEREKEKIHQVEEVEFKVPDVVVIRVYSFS